MPRTPKQYEKIRNEKKNLIKKTALELFANQGYTTTSINKIAQQANISKGLMYNYFESKEELLKVIITDLIDEIITFLDSDNDNIVTEEEALNFFDKYFELLMKRTEEMRFFSQFSMQPDVVKYIATEEQVINKSIKQRDLLIPFFEKRHKSNAKMAMISLSAILRGITVQYVFTPKMFSDDVMIQYKEYLKDVFIRKVT